MNFGFLFFKVPTIKKQLFDQVNIRLISQLINGTSSVLQKLLRYFKETIISTSFAQLLFVSPVIFCLNLNELLLLLLAGKSVITLLSPKGGSSP